MKHLLVLMLALTSLKSFAQRYEHGRAEKSIRVTQTSSRFDLSFQVPVYRVVDVQVPVHTTCSEAQCTTESGNGSSGHWHGFYNVPKEQKASALAAAVKGIGKSTADKIVDNNLLTHKPNSWGEFTSTIRGIESRLNRMGYNTNFASEVIEQYGYENRINLGYGSAESCRVVQRPCTYYVWTENRSFSHNIARHLTVSVRDQALQSFENDIISISAGTAPADLSVSVRGHNSYQKAVYNRGTELELTGSRIRSAFPINEVSVNLTKAAGGKVVTQVNVPSKFFNGEDAGSELQVIHQICTPGFLGIGCKAVTNPSIVKMTGPTVTLTTAGLKSGKKYYAKIRLQKLNSQFYSNQKSSDKDSNKVR